MCNAELLPRIAAIAQHSVDRDAAGMRAVSRVFNLLAIGIIPRHSAVYRYYLTVVQYAGPLHAFYHAHAQFPYFMRGGPEFWRLLPAPRRGTLVALNR